MFTLFEPSEKRIEKFLAAQGDLPFSYKEVGASRGAVPSDYPINHHRVQIGSGEDVFNRAEDAIKNWAMYRLDWTRLYPANAPVAAPQVVCVVVNHRFCWSLNSCRVIYVLEENGEIEKYGFAFGTLPDHSEEGEERFTVEWRRGEDDSVWYELLSFARPHHVLAKIGFPFVELVKKKFASDSGWSMLEAASL